MNGNKLGLRPYLIVVSLAFACVSAQAASETDMRNAKKLYERLTGVKVNSSKPELKKVADLLAEGKKLEAARYVTTLPDFLNVQVKNLALRLSNKDESVKVGFSDFAALIVGVVRDNKDFRDILTADYFYELNGVTNQDDLRTRHYNQSHFVPAETTYMDLTKALVHKPRQQMVVSSVDTPYNQKDKSYPLMTLANNPEPAGVLSTRTFAERALGGGTNRRAVEFSLKQFLCVSMAEAADSSASDQYVGRDVERFPAGDYNKYLTSCKSCHSVMDGMRGAFAKMDYANFTNSGATGVYSVMHGDFFKDNDIAAAYNKYLADVVNPTTASIIPDLETNQENSIWYKTRYDYLIMRGQTAVNAKNTLDAALIQIRDPKIVTSLIAEYRVKKAAALADFRTNRNDATYRTNYVKTCLDHLGNTAITAEVQEQRFLQCNLDSKKDMSVLYAYYGESMAAKGVSQADIDKLQGKLVNRNRQTNNNYIRPYLEAKEQLKLYPRNVFDSDTGVATKMNKGSYAYGFVVKSDSFVNNATLGSKATFFGWRGPNKDGGNGPKDFGRMLADSRRFSQCMAKRVYEGVCMKKLESTQYTTLVRLGDRFEALNYNLKGLYQEIALDPVCGLIKDGE
ncbi:hypothetical protein [Bdellovibrio reynosensis]|uniref:DUF1592 domain-containing protein n=1 Tax=Bdellovibrio reynosensis TaxID=2835041 RepID=A0ABY4CAR1_9BACT|nr:hypothetical protein [Bdellovibrio reynosensis]UOF02062.1 hypothetical protein MNR06_03720 [Bdellovibrio reynosensis]